LKKLTFDVKKMPPAMPEKRDFLPASREEMTALGWEQADVIIVSGDAYVDHPAFGHAVIGRILQNMGFRVAILPQPNWRDDLRDFKKLGKPRLFFGITAGCMDSMVNHYTAFKRLRSDDAYTPGGKAGFRPDRASVVYTGILKQLFPETPVILGGVEASLRRTTHYDYWDDALRQGILQESGADLLVFGLGDLAIREIARAMNAGTPVSEITGVYQTAFMRDKKADLPEFSGHETIQLPSHEECLKSRKAFAKHFMILEEDSNRLQGARCIQDCGKQWLVMNPAGGPMPEAEVDATYDLPYTRMPHPRYRNKPSIPAWEMIRNSVNIHRGCFGGCSFCTISAHQGKFISSRTPASILREVEQISAMPGFSGHITDLGGPSANMYRMKGLENKLCLKCKRASCIYPAICKNLNADHGPLTELYHKASAVKGVKRITIGSGVRYDMLVNRPQEEERRFHYGEYTRQLVRHHVSGRLKIAPEHTSDAVLRLMRKPSFRHFQTFSAQFHKISREAGLQQEIIPYFISSHPGCTETDMAELAVETRNQNLKLEQIQDFTPTPMTLSSVMQWCGFDPYTGRKLHLSGKMEQKAAQHMYFFWYKKDNKPLIIRSLKNAGRADLISRLYPR
jgi:uncharacterized radical SAM protein YgiQ